MTAIAIDGDGELPPLPAGLSVQTRDQAFGDILSRTAAAKKSIDALAIIIADEPTASLDYVQVEGVLRLLRDLATAGRVVVVATHDDRLLPLADQIIEMVPRFHEELTAPTTTQLASGEVQFTPGSRGNRIYVIESGSIEILRNDAHGTAHRLATFGVDEYFGEMGPLFSLPRSATARAGSPTVVIGYTPEQSRQHIGAERLTDLIRHGERTDGNTL